MKKINIIRKHDGFTIIELVIATSVFGVMLLLASSGMVQIGRAYYKGITSSKTQSIAREVEQDVTNNIKTGGSPNIGAMVPTGYFLAQTGYDLKAYCVGNTRYSYVINVKAASANDTTTPKTIRHALWLDRKIEGTACNPVDLREFNPSANPIKDWGGGYVTEIDVTTAAQHRDLLANNMRLTNFSIDGTTVATGVSVDLKVLYGDEDIINTVDNTCKPNSFGGQFCAFSELHTFVQKR